MNFFCSKTKQRIRNDVIEVSSLRLFDVTYHRWRWTKNLFKSFEQCCFCIWKVWIKIEWLTFRNQLLFIAENQTSFQIHFLLCLFQTDLQLSLVTLKNESWIHDGIVASNLGLIIGFTFYLLFFFFCLSSSADRGQILWSSFGGRILLYNYEFSKWTATGWHRPI